MQTVNARAYWVTARSQGEIRDCLLTPPDHHEVLVETLYSGISRATESLVFRGEVPASEYARMRAPFQEGDFPWPVKYGYSNVGRVIDGEPKLRDKLVFCLYPHQTRYVVGTDRLCLVPDDVPPERAVLAANMETALNALWDAGVMPGDKVTVVGGGSVGSLVGWLVSRMPGCELELIEPDDTKHTRLRRLGLTCITETTASGERDVVINASASAAGLRLAISLAGFESKIVELSWYGDTPISLALGGAFHSQRLKLISSQVGQVSENQRARWSHRRRLQTALGLLNESKLDCLITGESSFTSLPQTMRDLCESSSEVILHRIRYHS